MTNATTETGEAITRPTNAHLLTGKTIASVRRTTPTETKDLGWRHPGVIIYFTDKTHLLVVRDPEVNGPGALCSIDGSIVA